MDLDGTIIDHVTNTVPKSTKKTIKQLQDNGHIVVIATGRPPCLFYNVDKTLNVETYIAANGRYVVHRGETLLNEYLNPKMVEKFVSEMRVQGYDIGFETKDQYVVTSISNHLVEKFSEYFHLPLPKIVEDFHKDNDILQMILFSEKHPLDYLKSQFPNFDFNTASPYGVDINKTGGMKEVGVDVVLKALGFNIEDSMSIGDGFNDIGMLKHTNIGIAMGNANEALKEVADYITKSSHEDGIEYIMKKLGLI